MIRATWQIYVLSALLIALFSSKASAEQRLVNFTSAEGTEITAIYVSPAGETARLTPLVVMMHGCGGVLRKDGRLQKRDTAWVEILKNEGWAILLPNSFGARGKRTICTDKPRTILTEKHRQYDALGALLHAKSLPGIDPNRIALMGWSNGATSGLWYINTQSPARPKAQDGDYKTAVLFYPGCNAVRKKYPNYAVRFPTLIHVAGKDNWTSPKPCQKLVAGAKTLSNVPFFLDFYPDAVHGFDHPSSKPRTRSVPDLSKDAMRDVRVGTHAPSRDAAIARTLEWLRAHLNP